MTDPGPLILRLDLFPAIAQKNLMRSSRQLPPGPPGRGLDAPADLPHRLAEALLDAARIPARRIGPDLSRRNGFAWSRALKGAGPADRGHARVREGRGHQRRRALDEVDPGRSKAGSCPACTSPARCWTSTA